MDKELTRYLDELPLIAILRGIQPDECLDIGHTLFEIGFRLIEIPLNSPDPFKSIKKLAFDLNEKALIGAGTIFNKKQLQNLCDAGGKLAVMPHSDLELIRKAKSLNLICIPGVASPSEAIAALNAGADALKVFPAEMIVPRVLKAWKSILPEGTKLFPVGGILPSLMSSYLEAGATGFGLGSALYLPGQAVKDVQANGKTFFKCWKKLEIRMRKNT